MRTKFQISSAYGKATRRIATGYRMLFPLSVLTVLFVGIRDYEQRTNRYAAFTRRVLASQQRQSKAIQN